MKLKSLVVGVVVVGLVGLSGHAFAAGPPYTVSVGGSSAPGSHAITAASTGTVAFNVRNNAGTVINYNCTSVSLSGTATSGSSVNPFAVVSSTTWTGCTQPGGAATITQVGSWDVNGTGGNATSGTESIAGRIAPVTATYSTTANPSVCSFTFSGAMKATFKEASTQQLIISETGYTGDLVLSNVSGCLGRLQNGNPMNLVATLIVTSPDGAINLS